MLVLLVPAGVEGVAAERPAAARPAVRQHKLYRHSDRALRVRVG